MLSCAFTTAGFASSSTSSTPLFKSSMSFTISASAPSGVATVSTLAAATASSAALSASIAFCRAIFHAACSGLSNFLRFAVFASILPASKSSSILFHASSLTSRAFLSSSLAASKASRASSISSLILPFVTALVEDGAFSSSSKSSNMS